MQIEGRDHEAGIHGSQKDLGGLVAVAHHEGDLVALFQSPLHQVLSEAHASRP